MSAPIAAGVGAPYARLLSVASYVPSRVVDNAEMCTFIDSSDEWIQQRTGIAERRWVGEGETVETMALAAARTAVERAGIDPADIGAVIVSTVTYFHQTPSLAAKLAYELGTNGAAFDISAACAGFCYGLAQAESLVRSGAAKYAVVIGVEELSRFTDIHDRSTAFLFADGAGAAVVGPSETNGIGPVVWGSDGSQADAINQTSEWSEAMQGGTQPYIAMDGRAVFKWASGFIADATKKVLEVAQLSPEELDVFIPHQANNRITDAMLRHLKLPENVVVARTIKQFGNNSAASVPMAMDQLLSTGQAKSGQTALLIGFGAGLVYAGQVVTLP
ncbi:beta-ketoacyl-ACP synthase III [Micropruina glycogenica]|uniref:Beta-ketoacyl-[acyl-carrier-protein] synthase III n=1 Tax=Micropruina glycogenica TaxID=75385 RepID=A0A2N9JFL2_9ACTN|nr:beta-ketoacyl-ACP synthase III [Micropruina glycogenica]SPD86329.1 3-oxoacyl-[acyl-carrier-protein] synthase III [Micropruina glycogenica]